MLLISLANKTEIVFMKIPKFITAHFYIGMKMAKKNLEQALLQ